VAAAAVDDGLEAVALDDDAAEDGEDDDDDDDDELPPQPAVNNVAAAPTASAAMGVIFTRLLLRVRGTQCPATVRPPNWNAVGAERPCWGTHPFSWQIARNAG
jgi:hypothetical protein